ncbi:MAG TPA: hypothetical protein VMN78_09815 [Longimicrobiales bacterium]|nr:hypothetical protein [Longimicrobiales bacterium]
MKLARSFVAIMAVAALTGCDDNGDGDPDPNIAGVYTVTEFRYTADESGESIDLAGLPASVGGPYGILDMTVAADNSFTGTLKLPTPAGPQEFDIGGDIDFTGGNTLRIDFDAATDALGQLDDFEDGTFSMIGNTLTIILPNVTFDFGAVGGTPGEVDADLRIVGSRS